MHSMSAKDRAEKHKLVHPVQPVADWMVHKTPGVGERVLPGGADHPDNQWNHSRCAWVSLPVAVLQVLPLLYFLGLAAMAIAEFIATDADRHFSMKTWWVNTLIALSLAGYLLILTAALGWKKRPLGQKNKQFTPPPMQSYKVHLLAAILFAGAFWQMDLLENVDNPEACEHTHRFLTVMTLILLGTIASVQFFIIAITLRSPVILPTLPNTDDQGVVDTTLPPS